MKIHSDQIQALQEQSETRAKPKAAEGFEALLAEQAGAAQGFGGLAQAPAPGVSASTLAAQIAAQTADAASGGDESAGLDQVAREVDSLLGNLDEYGSRLSQRDGADLRGAYALLQGMGQELAALRAAAPNLAQRHAGLDAVVNELETLAVTETFKFNRGDYL